MACISPSLQRLQRAFQASSGTAIASICSIIFISSAFGLRPPPGAGGRPGARAGAEPDRGALPAHGGLLDLPAAQGADQ